MNQRGFGYIEIAIVLAVVAVTGYVVMQYLSSMTATVKQLQEEKPLAKVRLAADRATLQLIETSIRRHQAENGQPPPDRAAVIAPLMASPVFQCSGNDFVYEPATGNVRLTIADDAGCN